MHLLCKLQMLVILCRRVVSEYVGLGADDSLSPMHLPPVVKGDRERLNHKASLGFNLSISAPRPSTSRTVERGLCCSPLKVS